MNRFGMLLLKHAPSKVSTVASDIFGVSGRATTEALIGGHHHLVYFTMDEGLAVMRSADPDPERAAELAREGLALASPFQTAHAGSRLGRILAAAEPFDTHPAVRDLAEFGAAWRADRVAEPADDS
jgi:hypothetical protein